KSERRRNRHRPSARCQRRAPRHHRALPVATHPGALCAVHHVHRRGPGDFGHHRTRLNDEESCRMKPLLGYRKPAPGTQPNHVYPPYVSSIKRAPKQPLVTIPVTLSEITGPSFPKEILLPKSFDLTRHHKGEPLGERIAVSGRVVDEDGRPIRHTLVEIWQANAAGRYLQ